MYAASLRLSEVVTSDVKIATQWVQGADGVGDSDERGK